MNAGRMLLGLSLMICLPLCARGDALRPPATPLITHDPYMSCWSVNDRLYDDWPKHWTGRNQAMCGIIRVDGQALRFMGGPNAVVNTVEQKSLSVTPTQSVYTFACAGVDLAVTFTSPLLPDDLDILSRPASYVTFSAVASDGKPHSVQIYFDASGEWCVNKTDQKVKWNRMEAQGLDVMCMGAAEQDILGRAGDDRRIDWGYLMLAVPKGAPAATAIGSDKDTRGGFSEKGLLPEHDDTDMPRAAEDRWPVLAALFDLGNVETQPLTRHLIVAYDDLYAIEYFNKRLRAWWRRDPEMTARRMIEQAEAEYAPLLEKCAAFDKQMMDDATRSGGEAYSQLCALAYRQAIAGNKLAAGPAGQPMLFPKECFSNGCIATVDVIYPMAPVFLLYSPALARAMLTPVMEYAASPRWRFPFAPHDLGTYPKANGQVYGGGEKTEKNQMQVEESGNMILLTAALAKIEGNTRYAEKYWGLLTKWANYLKAKGLDPENQLCTDDFTGHLAHNVNLSAKAISALGAYALLCDMAGKKDDAAAFRSIAEDFAGKWAQMADDGDHFRLAFDKPGTWSQKYNLVWDAMLGLNLFPKEIMKKEIEFYKKLPNRYGLPLDNRATYTKLDWTVWIATLADNSADFQALVAPILLFMNETPDRVPLSDWYDTVEAKKVGFQARPVIGGVFIKLLADKTVPPAK